MAADSVSHETALAGAIDVARLDELGRHAELAASLWHSVALAADRGDVHTLILHCHQLATVTKEAFALARVLGSAEAEA
jgi:hypothetical protein